MANASANNRLELDQINRACNIIAVAVIATYLVLMCLFFSVFKEHREFLLPAERVTALASATAMTSSLFLRLVTRFSTIKAPRAFMPTIDTSGAALSNIRFSHAASGVVNLSHAVIGIAAFTSWMFYLTRVPILIDPVTGCRTHMLRWCEWTVLAFAMTFMTEIADESRVGSALSLALSQGGSVAAGLVFPLCPGLKSWSITMAVSFICFFQIFPRWFQRRALYLEAFKTNMMDGKGGILNCVDVVDAMGRLQLSYRLLTTCVCIWTIFTVTFFLAGAAKVTGVDPRPNPEWPFVVDAIVDLSAKLIYTTIIVDLHGALFDPGELAERRLIELKEVMRVVWTASSDALAVSVRHQLPNKRGFRIETSVSPTAEMMLRTNSSVLFSKQEGCENASMLLDGVLKAGTVRFDYDELLDDEINEDIGERGTNVGAASGCVHDSAGLEGTRQEAASSLGLLMRRAWALSPEEDHVILHELQRGGLNGQCGGQKAVKCESKVTRLGPNRLIVVVRDITEREARYEAEKLLLTETTAREHDAAANRFTRHEVKNGLLAAIGLVDGIQELIERISNQAGGASSCAGISQRISELELTLSDTLNSVLSEAMARELAYDTYIPRQESVDVVRLLRSGTSAGRRFRLETTPVSLPHILIDPQLLHCIHRNAVSNACKYGERDGEVVTRLLLKAADDEAFSHELTLEVINKPGPLHDRLLQLDKDTITKSVFSPGKRLHREVDLSDLPLNVATLAAAVSSGDGGWIMRKCAGALGGNCSIEFFAESTVFTLHCPTRLEVIPLKQQMLLHAQVDATNSYPTETAGAYLVSPSPIPSNRAIFSAAPASASVPAADAAFFKLPSNCWGVGIDDSMMQRKLLSRMFASMDFAEKRVQVLGGSREEIYGFVKRVVDLVQQHPQDYFLIIADENLDVDDADMVHGRITISGSKCCANIREVLRRKELEAKVLTIVRSANDSSEDVRIYLSRAHGFLPKSPLDRRNFLISLIPIWLARFGVLQENMSSDCGRRDGSNESYESAQTEKTKNESVSRN